MINNFPAIKEKDPILGTHIWVSFINGPGEENFEDYECSICGTTAIQSASFPGAWYISYLTCDEFIIKGIIE